MRPKGPSPCLHFCFHCSLSGWNWKRGVALLLNAIPSFNYYTTLDILVTEVNMFSVTGSDNTTLFFFFFKSRSEEKTQQNGLPERVWISSSRLSCSWFPIASSGLCVVALLASWLHTLHIIFGCTLLHSGVPWPGTEPGPLPWEHSFKHSTTREVPSLQFKKITRDDELFSSFWFHIFLSVFLDVWFAFLCVLSFNQPVHFFSSRFKAACCVY